MFIFDSMNVFAHCNKRSGIMDLVFALQKCALCNEQPWRNCSWCKNADKLFLCFVLCCSFFTLLHHLVCCQSLIAFRHTSSVCILKLLSKLNAFYAPAQFEPMNKKKSSIFWLNVFLSDLFLALAFKLCRSTCDVINLYDLELFLWPHLRQTFIFSIYSFYFGSAVPKGPSDLRSADWPLQNSRSIVPACLGAAVKRKKTNSGRLDKLLSHWRWNAI